MNTKDMTIVKKESKALVEWAIDKEQVWPVYEDIDTLVKVFKNLKLQKLLTSDLIPKSEKISYVRKLRQSDCHAVNQLIETFIAEERLDLLLPVFEDVLKEISHATQVFNIALSTAVPFTSKQKERLREFVERKFSVKTRDIIETIDESLIGGFIVSVSDYVVDTSIRHQLQDLKNKL